MYYDGDYGVLFIKEQDVKRAYSDLLNVKLGNKKKLVVHSCQLWYT